MASPLTTAQIHAMEVVRGRTVDHVDHLWQSVPSYDEGTLEDWLAQVLPAVEGGQRAALALTSAYLSARLGVRPLDLDADKVLGALRGDVTSRQVYRRPFVTVWSMLKEHKPWVDAVAAGGARARATAAMDIQMTMRATAQAWQDRYGV